MIEFLLHTKVKIEQPRFKGEIAQWQIYQKYGRSHHVVIDPTMCEVWWKHLTCDCRREEKSANVQCILCNGNHSANYRGCSMYLQGILEIDLSFTKEEKRNE